MEIRKYFEEKAQIARQNRFLRFVVFLMAVAIIINGVYVYRASFNQKVVLVPLNISKEVYVSGDRASKEYLKAVAYLFLTLLYQYTPSSAKDQFETALTFIHPSFYSEMQRILYRRLKEIADFQINTTFLIETIEIDENNMTIRVKGTYSERYGTKEAIVSVKKLEIKYTINAGRFYITDLKTS